MRILVLGGSGMLGHVLAREAAERHRVWTTVREVEWPTASRPGWGRAELITGIDAGRPETVAEAVERSRPDFVINCIGIIKQRPEAKDPVACLLVNALFPHLLARHCAERDIRLVHLSTDCVFSGRKGHYSETDRPDPVDLYGHTKLLGEVSSPGALTLRTSMIGPELRRGGSLLEWFLGQRGGTVKGFTQAIFSGLTTPALSRLIVRVLEQRPDLEGLYHVAAEPIDKYTLLLRLRDCFGLEVAVEPDDSVVCDRSLDATRFYRETGWQPPSWEDMLTELAARMAAEGEPRVEC